MRPFAAFGLPYSAVSPNSQLEYKFKFKASLTVYEFHDQRSECFGCFCSMPHLAT